MPVIDEMKLNGILNEAEDRKHSETIKDNAGKIKAAGEKVVGQVKDNLWVTKQKAKKETSSNKITFKEDADGNIIDATFDGEPVEEDNKIKKLIDNARTDLTNRSTVELVKKKQEFAEKPGEKTGEAIGNIITGGNIPNTVAKFTGRTIGKGIDVVTKKIKKEDTVIYRSPEYTKVMNEYFDYTDTETRKVLLAVNEEDQSKVLVALTSKLYDNVVTRVDDIDFGEIELTKGDIEKLPNFNTLHECLNNMARLLIEFKQDTKPVDTVAECVSNMIESKNIWTKAYAVGADLPKVTYNTMVLAIIEATSYLVSMCVEFIKAPSQDTMKVMIDKSALTKSKGHMLFKNIESFNSAYKKGQVEKAMNHVIDENMSKKNFVGMGIYTSFGAGVAVAGVVGLLFCIVPIIRELIFLFYYTRVKVADFFEAQADLLQITAYNVENNRADLPKNERKDIAAKQMKVANKFRTVSNTISVSCNTAEKSASKDIKEESNKKYKASDVMEELPDSASSALF